MNVLFLSRTDWAGCAWFLSQAVDTLGGYSARHVRWAAPTWLQYPCGLHAPKERQWPALWDWADVVHVYDQGGPILDGMPPKPTVITYNGTLYRNAPGKHDRDAAREGWPITATTLDLTLGTAARWLPCARPSLEHLQDVDKYDTFTVCHAPTQRARKGTVAIEAALRGLSGVQLEVIERVSWDKCLRRKARAHVLIDQFPWEYGCNSVEAWLLGLPVISGKRDPAVLRAIERECDGGRLPYVAATPDTVRAAVLVLRDDHDLYSEMAQRGYGFALKHHQADAVAQRALPLYAEALERFEARRGKKEQLPGQEGMEMLKYVGRNDGFQTFFGEVTGQEYQFGRSRRFGWVDAGDAIFMLRKRRRRKRADFRRAM